MRVREKSLMDVSNGTAEMGRLYRGQFQDQWTAQPPLISSYSTPSAWIRTTDVVTPEYSRRISRGEVITNPYHSERYETTPPAPTFASRIETFNSAWMADGQMQVFEVGWKLGGLLVPFALSSRGAPALLDRIEGAAEAKAQLCSTVVTQAHANVDESEMLALATMAEAGKSVEFLVNTFHRAIRIGRAARKLQFRRLKREISRREFQDRYMEARYAIRPLIYDVHGVVNALQTKAGSRIRKTFRAGDRNSMSTDDMVYMWPVADNCMFADVKRSITSTVSVRAGVMCDLDISKLHAFGGSKLIETAWELAPLSFIFDWFGNIGTTIGAWAPKAGVNQLASWIVSRQIIEATNEVVAVYPHTQDQPNTAVNTASLGPVKWGTRTTYVERIPSPSLSMWPKVDINLDAYKLTDLGIILKKIFR